MSQADSAATLGPLPSQSPEPPKTPEPDNEANVHAADTYRRGALRWGYFFLLNGIAAVLAVAFFIGVFYADGLDPYMRGTYEWLLAHPGVTSFLAFSPLACSCLVGWGYVQRGKKRKAAQAARDATAAERKQQAQTAKSEAKVTERG
jgi:hypothetical protein